MKKFVTAAVFLVSTALPAAGHAGSLDDPLHCTVSAHAFISKLIDENLIDPQPSRVESNYINAFNLAKGADLHAFGYRVFAVVGYEDDDPLFRKGSGKRLSRSAYGAVVWGSTEKVQATVTAAQSPAIVHHVAPFITAIFCDRD
ncbi:hypothetical protein WKR88_11555 [Trinickia caryophylli]|uniref:Uncharacterized protein n=1 Tax=Trinickia caryophylli TaxID=28094 RepID=A0A1X7CWK9_TRICW|nr:hypothetical protein [Trinickia caryophylli]PMS13417.1 hypothetical protein C0Z17_03680 [Trinickia caryophylli]TRX13724.1 hypothetical protein FNF07_20280 [Trinickia caryophylli]WQE15312.1 hypothetical protein U0034_22505 [Trinickia caryophylli]SMF03961.1 hypothetical protein SAMN06295900_10257 [Trinickia caryophylli]GLU30934.1 hypothetical protein Busp01_07760 [Trinickia caryophylli]